MVLVFLLRFLLFGMFPALLLAGIFQNAFCLAWLGFGFSMAQVSLTWNTTPATSTSPQIARSVVGTELDCLGVDPEDGAGW